MNRILLLAFPCLTAGCGTYDGYFGKLIADGQFAAAPDKLKAQAEPLARQKYRSADKREEFIYSYYQGYESGLTCIHGDVIVGSGRWDPHNRGHQAGRAAAIAAQVLGGPGFRTSDDFYVRARFKGYLSPDRGGGVGHFNLYDREFVVREIITMERLEAPAEH
jgi:hypothetical protein